MTKIIYQHNVASGGACLPCGPSPKERWGKIAEAYLADVVKMSLDNIKHFVHGIAWTAEKAFPTGGVIGDNPHKYVIGERASEIVMPRHSYTVTVKRIKE